MSLIRGSALLATFVLACAPDVTSAQCAAGKVTGTFSSLVMHRQTGDLLGIEVRILLAADAESRKSYKATFQMAEGGVGAVSLEDVSFNGCHFQIRISKPRPDEVVVLEGDLNANGMEGELTFKAGHKERFKLPRRKSYWD